MRSVTKLKLRRNLAPSGLHRQGNKIRYGIEEIVPGSIELRIYYEKNTLPTGHLFLSDKMTLVRLSIKKPLASHYKIDLIGSNTSSFFYKEVLFF